MLRHRLPESTPAERDAAIREFREVAAERRRLALRGAAAVRELLRTGAHFHAGAASITHFAEMNGLSAYEAREFADLGRAVEAAPELRADVEAGTIPVASAAVLGQLADEPDIVRPDDRWVEWAKSKSTRDFRRLFAHRRDEARAGEPVSPVTAYVTMAVRENLERASALTSRKAHEALTLGQTLGVVLGDWLDDHDPLRKTPGTRRLPDTAQIPGSRYVPAQVDRDVRSRSADRCIVPLCTATNWVQRSHRVAHAEGGSREAGQLDLLCDYHHRLYEAGLLRIDGPADAPIFTDARGSRIDERHPYAGGRDGGGGGRDAGEAEEGPPRSAGHEGDPPGAAIGDSGGRAEGATGGDPRSPAPPGSSDTTDRTASEDRGSRRPPTTGESRGTTARS